MEKSLRNQTLSCTPPEIAHYRKLLKHIEYPVSCEQILDKIINQDSFSTFEYLPHNFVNLLFLDPPYNISKTFNSIYFGRKDDTIYTNWFRDLIKKIKPTLKVDASIYVCADWRSSALMYPVLKEYFVVQNRITWEREKGRGSKNNWKNNLEDIWFCSNSKHYYFNAAVVKLKKRVIAPYRENGKPKDWEETAGGGFRLTAPSNIWSDITIPFWSMRENTHHPTQKSEKLLAKIILASSKEHDIIFDPFLGSGTTAVVAKKLNRYFVGIEIDIEYCCWALKRLHIAASNKDIQGYTSGVFWERNSKPAQNKMNNRQSL